VPPAEINGIVQRYTPFVAAQTYTYDETAIAASRQRFDHAGTNVRGKALLAAAKALDGWFTWIPSQSVDLKSQADRDDFARWVYNSQTEITQESAMNCWEAVLYAAHKAGLKSHSELLAMYEGADHWHGPGHAPAVGRDRLMDYLGYSESFEFHPDADYALEPGDIVFLGGDHHIAIYEKYDAGTKQHYVCSHYKIPEVGFKSVGCRSLPPTEMKWRFAPCPF
jgi:hypothetical protein